MQKNPVARASGLFNAEERGGGEGWEERGGVAHRRRQ